MNRIEEQDAADIAKIKHGVREAMTLLKTVGGSTRVKHAPFNSNAVIISNSLASFAVESCITKHGHSYFKVDGERVAKRDIVSYVTYKFHEAKLEHRILEQMKTTAKWLTDRHAGLYIGGDTDGKRFALKIAEATGGAGLVSIVVDVRCDLRGNTVYIVDGVSCFSLEALEEEVGHALEEAAARELTK